jgi:hypothetical protein
MTKQVMERLLAKMREMAEWKANNEMSAVHRGTLVTLMVMQPTRDDSQDDSLDRRDGSSCKKT